MKANMTSFKLGDALFVKHVGSTTIFVRLNISQICLKLYIFHLLTYHNLNHQELRNWKPFRDKEMELLSFLVVTTNVRYSILNLLRYFIQRNFSVR